MAKKRLFGILALFALVVSLPIIYARLSADFDGNGEVGFTDFFLFEKLFGKKRGDIGYNESFNLNNDSDSKDKIDLEDFFKFAGEFGKKVEVKFDVGENCKEVINGQNSADPSRINIIFVGVNHNLKNFIDWAKAMVSSDAGLFSFEPYASNKAKFNVWYVDKIANVGGFDITSQSSIIDTIHPVLDDFASSCKVTNEYNIAIVDASFTSVALTGHNAAFMSEKGALIENMIQDSSIQFVHEFSHLFGLLRDEYISKKYPSGLFETGKNFQINNCALANKDSACQNWCKGRPKSVDELKQISCDTDSENDCKKKEAVCQWVKFKNEYRCRNMASLCTSLNVVDCAQTPTNYCAYNQYTDSYYQSQCFPILNKLNIGADCIGDTGCYQGCTYVDSYRSSLNSLMQHTYTGDIGLNSVSKLILCQKIRETTGSANGKCHELFELFGEKKAAGKLAVQLSQPQKLDDSTKKDMIRYISSNTPQEEKYKIRVGLVKYSFVADEYAKEPRADFDGNDIIDKDDFFRFADGFGKKKGDADYNSNFDLNNDGNVALPDFFIFADEFGKKAAQPELGDNEIDANEIPFAYISSDKASSNKLSLREGKDLIKTAISNPSERAKLKQRQGLALVETGETAKEPRADFNRDSKIDFGDFSLFSEAFNGIDVKFDLNNDRKINFDDFFIFADNFGKTAIMPENKCAVCPDLDRNGRIEASDLIQFTENEIDMNKDGVVNELDAECLPQERKILCSEIPTCFDGIKNQDETGIDYGGACLREDNQPPVVKAEFDEISVKGSFLELRFTIIENQILKKSGLNEVSIPAGGIDFANSYINISNESQEIKKYSLLDLVNDIQRNFVSETAYAILYLNTNGMKEGSYKIGVDVKDKAGNKQALQYPLKLIAENPDCRLMSGRGSNNNINILFVGDDFKNREEFMKIARRHAEVLSSVEPFKSNSKLLNFKALDFVQDFDCQGPLISVEQDIGNIIGKINVGRASAKCDEKKIQTFVKSMCAADYTMLLSRNDFSSFMLPSSKTAVVYVGKDSGSSLIRETLTYKLLEDSGPGDKAYTNAKLDCADKFKETPKVKEIEVLFEGKRLLFLHIFYKSNLIKDSAPEDYVSPEDLLKKGYSGYFTPPICGVENQYILLKFIEKINFEESSPKAALHEFGHSFGGLDDEYLVFKTDAPPGFISVNCIDPVKSGLPKIVDNGKHRCESDHNSKGFPVAGCTYNNLCSTDYLSIMAGSTIGRPYYGEKSEKHMSELLSSLVKKKSIW